MICGTVLQASARAWRAKFIPHSAEDLFTISARHGQTKSVRVSRRSRVPPAGVGRLAGQNGYVCDLDKLGEGYHRASQRARANGAAKQ